MYTAKQKQQIHNLMSLIYFLVFLSKTVSISALTEHLVCKNLSDKVLTCFVILSGAKCKVGWGLTALLTS